MNILRFLLSLILNHLALDIGIRLLKVIDFCYKFLELSSSLLCEHLCGYKISFSKKYSESRQMKPYEIQTIRIFILCSYSREI